jgi:hypothetical protein
MELTSGLRTAFILSAFGLVVAVRLRTGHGRNHSHIGHLVPSRPLSRVVLISKVINTNQLFQVSILRVQLVVSIVSRRLTILESPSSLDRCNKGDCSLLGMMAFQQPGQKLENRNRE